MHPRGTLCSIGGGWDGVECALGSICSDILSRMMPPGILVVIALLGLSSWVFFFTFRRLRRRHARRAWWVALYSAVAVGAALGYWLAFHFEYQPSSRWRFFSFPVPVVFFHLEDGQWVDFPTPKFFGYLAMFTNILIITASAILPVLLASIFTTSGKPRYDSTHAPPHLSNSG